MGITTILDTGKQALLAQQKAIQIAGQNVANVNTPGYSRERAHFTPVPTSLSGAPRFGVSLDQVTRVFDHFINNQVHLAASNYSSTQTQADFFARLEPLFNDLGLEEAGLAATIDRFFDAFQNLAGHPQGLAERTYVKTQAQHLVDLFHSLRGQMAELHNQLNEALTGELAQINELTTQIAAHNLSIQQIEVDANHHANTLRDERDLLLKQLAEKVHITAFENEQHTLTVLLGGGRPLLEGSIHHTLVAIRAPNDAQGIAVQMQDGKGNLTDVSERITGGKLQGLIESRDTYLADFSNRLDRLAAQLVHTVNQAHAAGYAQDGSTGNRFFTSRTVTAMPARHNTGGGVVQNATVFDPTQLTLDTYDITVVADGPPPLLDVVNATTGATLMAGQPYVSGAAIRFDGIEITLSDSGIPPQQGDRIVVNSTQGMAQTIAIDDDLANNLQKIAAARTPEPGDNTNAISLANLRHMPVLEGGTFGEFYNALVSHLGAQNRNTLDRAEHQQFLLTEVENQRESLSGVSLEEEQLDLIRFQQAFGAAARLIQVVDEMTDIVVNLIR